MPAGGRISYWGWFLRVFTWDGLLPLCVFLVPDFVHTLFPNNQKAIEVLAVALPILTLFLRMRAGINHIASNACGRALRFLQNCAFFIAILPLMLVDSLFIISVLFPRGAMFASRGDVAAFQVFVLFYLSFMTFAMYPGRVIKIDSDIGKHKQ